MLNKLRLKLTLTNVLVVSLIFLIFLLTIIFTMYEMAERQTNQLIDMVSTNAGFGNISSKSDLKNERNEAQYIYFYIKLDSDENIVSASPGINIKSKVIEDMVSMALVSPKRKDRIELKNESDSYRYVKENFANEPGTYIFFVNTNTQDEMLSILLWVVSLTSIAGIIVVFFGSRFMADRSLVPIKESWERQRDFIADASHEIRTPLSVIETTFDLITSKENQTVGSQRKWLDNIQTEIKRMNKLVNDLLFLARVDSGQSLIEMRQFPLHYALLESYIPFEALALKRKIHLEPFIGSEIEFWGDEARIKQLAVILIDNAIKYTPPGGHVGMKLYETDRTVQIIVSDTGEGMDEEHISMIFRRFFRVDKSRSRNEGSIGIGLSIAEWIVKEHSGTIKVESTKKKGTTFCVILPKTKPNLSRERYRCWQKWMK